MKDNRSQIVAEINRGLSELVTRLHAQRGPARRVYQLDELEALRRSVRELEVRLTRVRLNLFDQGVQS